MGMNDGPCAADVDETQLLQGNAVYGRDTDELRRFGFGEDPTIPSEGTQSGK